MQRLQRQVRRIQVQLHQLPTRAPEVTAAPEQPQTQVPATQAPVTQEPVKPTQPTKNQNP